MRIEIGSVTLECVEGEIADQRGFDAVVNAANARLQPGSGVAGAIHHVAGPELDQACRPLAPIRWARRSSPRRSSCRIGT